MKHFVIRVLVFIGVIGALGEVFFRVVIPARESPIARQEPHFKLMQFDQGAIPSGQFTSGRWAQQRSHWHINNLGWNSDYEYGPTNQKSRPVIAITGDSQIEGFYVSHEAHVVRQVEALSRGRVAGYSFGIAGYKLAEYIQVARYLAHHRIRPSVFVMYINRGDIWRAVLNLGGKRGTPSPRLSVENDVVRLVVGRPYTPPRLRRLFRWSALARYFVFNARLNPFKQGEAELGMTKQAAYPEAKALENPIYGQVLRYALNEVRRALPDTQIAFLVDADRRAIQSGRTVRPLGTSPVIKAVCAQAGCTHIDLTKTFETAWKSDGKSFSFEGNYHWNTYAHRLAAEAMYSRFESLGWLPTKNTEKR